MIKKIMSNKGSTLVTAVIIMIMVASLGVLTSLVLASNARISIRRIDKKMEIIETENIMYDFLNYLAIVDLETLLKDEDRKLYFSLDNELKSLKSDLNNEKTYYMVEFANGDGMNYIFTLKNKNSILECEISFSNKSYTIVSWSA